ncbi:MAG: hypothetical protein V1928_01730 [Parcubacteria group bacterium]
MINSERLIGENLEKMETEMWKLLANESWNGNAHYTEIAGEKWICAGANGYYDRASGRILIFSNSNLPDEFNGLSAVQFIVRVAVSYLNQHGIRSGLVVNAYLDKLSISPGREIMYQTLERYNFSQAENDEGQALAKMINAGLRENKQSWS